MVVVQHVNATLISHTWKHGNLVGMWQVKLATKVMQHMSELLVLVAFITCGPYKWYNNFVKWLIMV